MAQSGAFQKIAKNPTFVHLHRFEVPGTAANADASKLRQRVFQATNRADSASKYMCFPSKCQLHGMRTQGGLLLMDHRQNVYWLCKCIETPVCELSDVPVYC